MTDQVRSVALNHDLYELSWACGVKSETSEMLTLTAGFKHHMTVAVTRTRNGQGSYAARASRTHVAKSSIDSRVALRLPNESERRECMPRRRGRRSAVMVRRLPARRRDHYGIGIAVFVDEAAMNTAGPAGDGPRDRLSVANARMGGVDRG
jgi:hypothetical protein